MPIMLFYDLLRIENARTELLCKVYHRGSLRRYNDNILKDAITRLKGKLTWCKDAIEISLFASHSLVVVFSSMERTKMWQYNAKLRCAISTTRYLHEMSYWNCDIIKVFSHRVGETSPCFGATSHCIIFICCLSCVKKRRLGKAMPSRSDKMGKYDIYSQRVCASSYRSIALGRHTYNGRVWFL